MKARERFYRIANWYQKSAISAYSGQTAFFLMLSFFPFLMFFFTLLNLTPLSEADFIEGAKAFVPDAFQEVANFLIHDIYAGSTAIRLPITILTAVFLSSKSFISLQQGLNAMYGERETRNPLLIRVYAILYSVIFALFLLLILALLVFGHWINRTFLADIPIVGSVFGAILSYRVLLCVPILFLFFWIIYTFLPNGKHRAKGQIPGALFTALAWTLFSFVFSIYVDEFSNYSSFYGTMTTIALIMVWVYGCMYMLFLGGFINRLWKQAEKR